MADKRADDFGSLLASVAHAVARLERERVCCGALTYQQYQTLGRADRPGGTTIKTLAEALGIDESTASRNVSLLVRDGYLGKKPDPQDGRAVRLVLTPRGKQALTSLRCDERELLADVFAALPETERAPVLRALEQVDQALGRAANVCCSPPAVSGAARPRPTG